MKRIIFDFETRSKCDLKKSGAFKYSRDPSTQPTCLAFKIKGHKTVYLLPFESINRQWRDQSKEFKLLWSRLIDERYEFTGHNAGFERVIYENVLVARLGWPKIPARRYRCTAAKAAACAIPRNLEGAGEALQLHAQKDKRGYQAMMATCKPTKKWNAWTKARAEIKAGKRVGPKKLKLAAEPEPPVFLEPDAGPETFSVLYQYCKMDVRAEEALDDALPDLIPQEQEIWHLNQKLNWRGIHCDLKTIKKVVSIIEAEKKLKLKELDKLTMGLVTKPGARKSILEFLALEGIELPDLRAGTVDDKLKGFELSEDMHRLLEIRRALTMTSTRKYYSFLDRADEHGVIRDLVLYHGASTGRDGGSGINVYNFPRGLLKVDPAHPYEAVNNVANEHPDMLRILYGDSLAILFSAILRNMIVPPEGHELFVADFSKIEVAVLWWLANNEAGLEILRSGKDPYVYQAAANTGKTYEEVEEAYKAGEKWAFDARQLGKAQILGCGFRMGWKRFQASAWDMYRLRLSGRQSITAVKSYRGANAPVAEIWELYEEAAIRAVETGKTVGAGKCKFFVKDKFLWIELPSGRRLAYREPCIVMRAITYTKLEDFTVDGEEVETEVTGREKKTLQFLGLDKSKKRLVPEISHGGVLTENIVQATARDLMMPALLRHEKAGYRVMMSVYDEGICARPKGEGNFSEFKKLLCEAPEWAPGLPIEASGFTGPRYRK